VFSRVFWLRTGVIMDDINKEPIRDPEEVETQQLEMMEALEGAHVIEIGCGNGRLTRRYAAWASSVTGIDPEADAIQKANLIRPLSGGARLDLTQASATALPFRDASFTAALLAWSL
jgi:ubiquinone/menaquinone biosynthesis C-methylase UbiE